MCSKWETIIILVIPWVYFAGRYLEGNVNFIILCFNEVLDLVCNNLLRSSPHINVFTRWASIVTGDGLEYQKNGTQLITVHTEQWALSVTFLNPLVLFMPDPWMSIGWKKTVSPASISRWTMGALGSNVVIPWYILFTPPLPAQWRGKYHSYIVKQQVPW